MRADLDEIKHAGERATLLTKQLLAFSRHQVVNPQILDLNQIIGSLEKMLRRLLREDVELVTVAAPGLPGCRCDAGQIEQLIMNLAINGRDAMPEGGKLTVATADVQLDEAFARGHLGVRAGRHVMLTVADTGIGMDQATQARIFEPFFTTKEKGRGTGLGLSTVYGIVEQSGGTIWVESAPGRGTTFTVYLPASDQAGAAHSAGTDESHPRGSETILLVDDEDQIRKVAKGILQRHGYRVVEARNASEALQACEKDAGSIHLLVTDIVMPQMNGEQLADRLAAVCPAMKVLFMSGYTDGALVGRLAAGAAFLQKPVTPAALLRSVRQVLDAA
jgi:CheY-like chemotaxis protein